MTQRWRGAREGRTDYFDEETFDSEQEGLGGTQAARLTQSVSMSITPGGPEVRYNCPQCTRAISFILLWPEVGMMAHGLRPDDPRWGRLGLTQTKYTDRPGGNFSPDVPCRTGCSQVGVCWITKKEMETALRQGMQNGFVQADRAGYAKLQAALNPMRQQQGMPPL